MNATNLSVVRLRQAQEISIIQQSKNRTWVIVLSSPASAEANSISSPQVVSDNGNLVRPELPFLFAQGGTQRIMGIQRKSLQSCMHDRANARGREGYGVGKGKGRRREREGWVRLHITLKQPEILTLHHSFTGLVSRDFTCKPFAVQYHKLRIVSENIADLCKCTFNVHTQSPALHASLWQAYTEYTQTYVVREVNKDK